MIRFSDGVQFDLTGPMRVERRSDGYYVVGDGMLIPVKDRADGERLIDQLRKEKAHGG